MRIMMRWRWRKRRKWGTVISDIVSGNAAKVIVLCFCSGLCKFCTLTVTERIVMKHSSNSNVLVQSLNRAV